MSAACTCGGKKMGHVGCHVATSVKEPGANGRTARRRRPTEKQLELGKLRACGIAGCTRTGASGRATPANRTTYSSLARSLPAASHLRPRGSSPLLACPPLLPPPAPRVPPAPLAAPASAAPPRARPPRHPPRAEPGSGPLGRICRPPGPGLRRLRDVAMHALLCGQRPDPMPRRAQTPGTTWACGMPFR